MHVRRSIRDGVDLTDVMSANWLLNAYNLVTTGKGAPKDGPELRTTKEGQVEHSFLMQGSQP